MRCVNLRIFLMALCLVAAGFAAARAQEPAIPAEPKAPPKQPAEPKADPKMPPETRLDPKDPSDMPPKVVPNTPETAIVPGRPLAAAAAPPGVLKMFRVAHLKPAEVETLFTMVMGSNSSLATLASAGYAAAGSPGGPPPALASDEKAKAVFVRGSEEQIAGAQAILSAFDKPREEWAAEEFNGAMVIPVQNTTVGRIGQILGRLRLNAFTMPVGKVGGLIVVRATPEVNSQIGEVVKSLDIADTKPLPPTVPKPPEAMPPMPIPPNKLPMAPPKVGE